MLRPNARPLLAALLPLLLAALLVACKSDGGGSRTPSPAGSPTPPDKVTFMAGFKPQANLPFVGAYVAKEKGFFAEQNLEVEIQHVNTPGDNFKFLGLGQVQFSTADATTVIERAGDDPPLGIVAVALIGQRGQQGFAVLADSGIETPVDWAGKRAGYKGTQPTPDFLAILNTVGVKPRDVGTVKVGFEPQILTEGQVDIFPVFVSNEPDTLRKLGYDVRVFEAAEFGAPTLGLTYVTTRDYLSQNPDIVLRFLKAALRGIEYARDNPDEALDIVMQYAPQEDRDHQRFMLDTELAAAQSDLTDENGIGWMTPGQWRELHDYLVEFDGIPGSLDDVSVTYDDHLIRQAYKDGKLIWP
ncbi:MAG: ABC transporter substrate-binding protein [Dehalococcoidia bacterium]|nr:ABC transporter substrate-binding protein [Dehalococcoidia bacterium]